MREESRKQLADLIEASYSDEVARRFRTFKVESHHLNEIGAIGKEILEHTRPIACACTAMSAMWVGIVRDRLALPVYQVAGDLFVEGKPAFAGGPEESVSSAFDRSTLNWDGHSWLAMGEYIGDLSVCRTAYRRPPASRLRNAVVQRFGPGKGLLLMKATDFKVEGFSYRAKYVLTERQVDSLMLGARELFT